MKKAILTVILVATSYAQAGSLSLDNINKIETKFDECAETALSTMDSRLCALEAN